MKIEVHIHRLPGDDDPGLEARIVATVSEKIAALKAEFDAALARVEARLTNEAVTAADLSSLDDMTTRAKGFAAEPTPAPAPSPVEPAPPAPMPPT